MLALPPLVRLNAEEEGAPPIRRLRFVLRLFAAAPIPATLRARAEVLCRARTAVEGDWRLALTPQRAGAARAAIATQRPIEETGIPNSPSLIAALTLALPMPADPSARLALGRPVSGRL